MLLESVDSFGMPLDEDGIRFGPLELKYTQDKDQFFWMIMNSDEVVKRGYALSKDQAVRDGKEAFDNYVRKIAPYSGSGPQPSHAPLRIF